MHAARKARSGHTHRERLAPQRPGRRG